MSAAIVQEDLSLDISKDSSVDISKLSKKELEDLSWKYLDIITEQMDKLPDARKAAIIIGKTLSNAGLIYEHVIDAVRIKAQVMQEMNQAATKTRGK